MSDRALDAIKSAILLEIRGNAFYNSVAESTDSEAVREMFSTMAVEEKKHEAVLEKHYISLVQEGQLAVLDYDADGTDLSEEILGDRIKGEIEASSYEAAAISAAMSLEKEAIRVYNQKADEAEDETERDLFEWLVHWEETHLAMLSKMDRALMEEIWFDNRFWPEI